MTLDYGNYGRFLIMGNAGFILPTVALVVAASYNKGRLRLWPMHATVDPSYEVTSCYTLLYSTLLCDAIT